MPPLKFTPDGPPALRADEYAQCQAQDCKAEFSRLALEQAYRGEPSERIWNADYERAVCPACGAFESFVKRRREGNDYSWEARWGKPALATGVTPMANLLARYLKPLGLDATDLGLLTIYESYRRTANDAAWPSQKTMAELSGLSERTIRDRLKAWTKAGLCERVRSFRHDGSRGNDRITRHGLTRALAHIGENVSAGREPTAGLPMLLRRLRAEAGIASAEPAPSVKLRRVA